MAICELVHVMNLQFYGEYYADYWPTSQLLMTVTHKYVKFLFVVFYNNIEVSTAQWRYAIIPSHCYLWYLMFYSSEGVQVGNIGSAAGVIGAWMGAMHDHGWSASDCMKPLLTD